MSKALVKYGWTKTKIEAISHGSIQWEGGELDGLSFNQSVIPDAKVGQTYLVNIQPSPPFAFGKIDGVILVNKDNEDEQ